MDKIIKRKNSQVTYINNFLENTYKVGKDKITLGYLESRVNLLEKYWDTFLEINNSILDGQNLNDAGLSSEYLRTDEFTIVEELYSRAAGELKDAIYKLQKDYTLAPEIPPAVGGRIKLPPIHIPKFSGDYFQWSSFSDLFTSLIVEDNSISKVQKLHFLKSSLSGEAEKLLRQFLITEANFDPAWALLKKRYSNKRLLLNAQFDKLLMLPKSNQYSAEGIKRILDTSAECLTSIDGLLEKEKQYDALIVHIISQKLDSKTHAEWEDSIRGEDDPAEHNKLFEFLEQSFRKIELVHPMSYKRSPNNYNRTYTNESKNVHLAETIGSRSNCACCNKPHKLFYCPKFKSMTIAERNRLVSTTNICRRCLSSNHLQSECTSQRSCKSCSASHNSMLHSSDSSIVSTSTSESSSGTLSSNASNVLSLHSNFIHSSRVLLATAQILIRSASGRYLAFRALVDQGSQATLITRKAVSLLQLRSDKSSIIVQGLGNTKPQCSTSVVSISLSSIYDNSICFETTAIMLPKLTNYLPSQPVVVKPWAHLQGLELADPSYYQTQKIDVIIGADVYSQILQPGIRKGNKNEPIAQKTALGWILSGSLGAATQTEPISVFNCFISEDVVNKQLRQFWELEDIPDKSKPNEEDNACELHYKNTHKRSANGTYVVRLPFKDCEFPSFGLTRKSAITRLCQMEKRLGKDSELNCQYNKFMAEYQTLGHMKPIHSIKFTPQSFYLPHHGVIKASSSTTKLRVVFDASIKSSDGFSLNDKLYTGPTLQRDLMQVLLRWRLYKVAVSADIEKMYRQIRIADDHQAYQKIVWRNESQQLQEFQLTTVTYGTSCAPYLAIRTLHQLAKDEEQHFKLAADKIMREMYVDDLISGGDSIEEALVVQNETINLLKRGGFHLRKWSSNEKVLCMSVPERDRETIGSIDISRDETIKTLGLHWSPSSDTFHFRVVLSKSDQATLTKRRLLSDISRVFDPLGWLAPVTVKAKILFQQLWLLTLKWDDPLPSEVYKDWFSIRNNMHQLESLSVPRWTGIHKASTNLELHGFCDASLKAYAAVIYTRVPVKDGVEITLLTAKTRVAPIKQISLPHLELCGAVLLAKLFEKVTTAFAINNMKLYAWTDSTIVLHWLNNTSHKKIFVANRINAIRDQIHPTNWSHVRSPDNPADIASRGILPQHLKDQELWWEGPNWLKLSESEWPKFMSSDPHVDFQDENDIINSNIGTVYTNIDFAEIVSKFSTRIKLTRVIAYCLRFASNCKIKDASKRYLSYLSVDEHGRALTRLLCLAQYYNFADDIIYMRKHSKLPSKSSLLSLNPFLCEEGLFRVGGRLHNANEHFNQKHPIILHKNNHLTMLIITEAHLDTLHGGLKVTLANLRLKYWVPNARTAIRSVIHNCKVCLRFSEQMSKQIMGALPSSRVTQSKVFSHTGIDYAGPMDIRMSKHRGKGTVKAYVAVFICMSTKAAHLELVTDLSSNTFIAAFKRFVARRGYCSDLYSDCGTNFVGADRILSKAASSSNLDVVEHLASKGTRWHFNPPGAPHQGGLWEAAVKTMKFHLKRVIGATMLTYEELNTIIIQIEAIMNSRPLHPLSSDPNDTNALTPGHFLVGGPLTSVPEPTLLNSSENRLQRWQLTEKITQDFWKSWSKDYIVELQQRHKKWAKEERNISIGDLVLVKDDRYSPLNWPLARVVDVFPGQDGKVRVVSIKLRGVVCKRPIVKLSLLPIQTDN